MSPTPVRSASEPRPSALLVSILLAGCAAPEAPESAGGPPNVVLVLCDDMGWSDLGCYGGEIETPNLDRLAAEGLRFTQFYNNAKCTTTRASLLTGLYPRGAGDRVTAEMVTLGEVLRAAGYRTILSGKWHLGSKAPHRPVDRGFDESFGLWDGCSNHFDPARRDPDFKGGRVRFSGRNDERITEFPEDFYSTDAFTDHAVESIRESVADGAPFFAHLAYTAPHYPLHARPEDVARYRGRYRDVGWDELRRQRFRRQQELGLVDDSWTLSGRDSRAYDWETADHDWEDERMATYAAMIHAMDRAVGRLLRALEELGVADDTVVIFLSDNGGCSEEPGGRRPYPNSGTVDTYTAVGPAWGWAQNAPFRRYKSWVHEGGIATPLIVRWPGVVPAASLTDDVGHVVDFMPTLLELADAEYPETFEGEPILPTEGRSLVSVFRGEPREGHAVLAWEWGGNCAVREGRWKLVWDKLVKRTELYDLEVDRTETNDLADEHPELVSRLRAAYEEWALATGRRIPWRTRRP